MWRVWELSSRHVNKNPPRVLIMKIFSKDVGTRKEKGAFWWVYVLNFTNMDVRSVTTTRAEGSNQKELIVKEHSKFVLTLETTELFNMNRVQSTEYTT